MSEIPGWQLVSLPAAIAAIPGVVKLWQWWRAEQASEAAQSASAADRERASITADREALNKSQLANLVQVEAERDRALTLYEGERAKRLAVEADRDRGWDLARWYYRRFSDAVHALLNAQTVIGALANRCDPPATVPTWPEWDVPANLEDVKR